MSQQTKLGYELAPSIYGLSSVAAVFCLLPLMLFLGLRIYKKQSVPLHFLIIVYLATLSAIEFLFWTLWKDNISKALKNKNWVIEAYNHPNCCLAIILIILDIILEFFLIKVVLDIKVSIVLVFFVLIGSKVIGSFVQTFFCYFFGRKKILIMSNLLFICIILLLFQPTLSIKWLISLIIAKGLFGNISLISRTLFADYISISIN